MTHVTFAGGGLMMVSDDESATSHPEGHGHGGWAEPVGESSRESSHKSFDASNAPEPGPGSVESKEEREGVPPDDMTARSALGVGESTNRRGEDLVTKGSGGSDRETDEETGEGAPPANARAGIDPHEPSERS